LAARFDQWLQVQNYALSTRIAYGKIVASFLAFLRSQSALTTGPTDVRAFLAHLIGRGASPQKLAHTLWPMRSFFDFLYLGGLMNRNPARMVATRKLPKRLPRWLSEEEVARLIEAARTPRDRALVEMLYATGCRAAEVAGMRVGEINWRNRSIRVLGKGNKERVVFFGSKAALALRNYLQARTTGPVFRSFRRKALNPDTIARIVKKIGKRAGLDGVHTHTLRHSFATALLNRGADIRAVQELLGHASLRQTQVYTHVAIADLVRTYSRCHPRG